MTDTMARTKPQIIRYRPTLKYHLERCVKRTFDICAALCGLVILSPLFLLTALWLKREGPGPVLYRGRRIGRGGCVFKILKFRTMREDAADDAGPGVTAQDDPRITPLGRWLRDTKLNELPQLWNVLIGEMSLVGPRPEDPQIAKAWPAEIRREILSVRPGITSPASIVYRDEEKLLRSATVMDDYLKVVLPDKLRLDQLYVRHHTFLSDLDIIFWTLIVLLPRLRDRTRSVDSFYNGLLYRFMSRYFSWFLADLLVAFGAVSIAGLLWRLSAPLDLGIQLAITVAAGIALVFSLINSILGLGRIWWRYARPRVAFDLAFSSMISTALLVALDFLWPSGAFLPLGMVFVTGLLAFLGFMSIRYRERLLTGLATRWLKDRWHGDWIGERVLIVGAGECGLLANWLLRRSKLSSAFTVIGMVDDDPAKKDMTIDGHYVFGFTGRIPELVTQQDVGVILFAIEKIDPAEQARILSLCRQTQARVVLIPDLMDMLRERLESSLSLGERAGGEGVAV
jgi:lipopolysaccharide/colanic/teichoic acid biosynthesis glycosyltransferase